MKTLFRYEIEYKNIDDDTKVVLRKYEVLSETEHSYFIKHPRMGWGYKKRIAKRAYNSFAYDDQQKAREHFIRRTMRRISWFEFWKSECEKALEIIERTK